MSRKEYSSDDEILSICKERFKSPYTKIVDIIEAQARSIKWRQEGEIVVIVDSILDIPHYRHADFLLKCANLGDKLILRINTDKFVSTRKDPRGPIVSLEYRLKHAAHYPYVDLITIKDVGGWSWLDDYCPNYVVKSVTSGPEVLKEILNVSAYLDKPDTKIIIMDEYANIIPFEKCQEEGLKYEESKFGADKISGSIIKREIINRYKID